MRISITIESRLNGSAAGHVELNVETTETVNGIISAFCAEKGILQSRQFVLRNTNDDVLHPSQTLAHIGVADGDVLYLTRPKEDMFGFHNWYAMSAAAFAISVIGLVALSITYSYNGTIPDDYGIVFDAGSTHTSMTVYSWGGSKLNNTGTPKQIYQCNMQGICNYPTKDKLQDALKNCLNNGKSKVAAGKVGTTPLFLGATAGIRLLSIKNKTDADKIMQVVDETFSSSGFHYQSGMAGVLSGTTEGANAWVTTNYAENILTSTTSKIPQMGTLDLGGASTQFATVVAEEPQLLSNISVAYLTLYGQPQNVSVNSYLCFGQVQAFSRHKAQMTLELKNKSNTIYDPCLPSGYNITIPLDSIFESPCTWNQSSSPSFNKTSGVTFVGTSNSSLCLPLVAKLFDESYCEKHFVYCFIRENLGGLHQNFLAISGFYEAVNNMNLTQPNLTEFMSSVNQLCDSPWEKVRHYQNRLTGKVSSFSEWYCFEGMFVAQLLTVGYNFTETAWANSLSFRNTVNDIDLGWSMGLMINATNDIAPEMPKILITVAMFSSLIVIFVILLFVAVALTVHARMGNRRAPVYQRCNTILEDDEDYETFD